MSNIIFKNIEHSVNAAISTARKYHKSLGHILDGANERTKIQHVNIEIEPNPISVHEFIGKGYELKDVGYVLKESFYNICNVKFYIYKLNNSRFGPKNEVCEQFKIEFNLNVNNDDCFTDDNVKIVSPTIELEYDRFDSN